MPSADGVVTPPWGVTAGHLRGTLGYLDRLGHPLDSGQPRHPKVSCVSAYLQ